MKLLATFTSILMVGAAAMPVVRRQSSSPTYTTTEILRFALTLEHLESTQ